MVNVVNTMFQLEIGTIFTLFDGNIKRNGAIRFELFEWCCVPNDTSPFCVGVLMTCHARKIHKGLTMPCWRTILDNNSFMKSLLLKGVSLKFCTYLQDSENFQLVYYKL